jgi:hypothetical protein
MTTRLGGATGMGRLIGFAGGEKILSTAMGGSQAVVQVWDAPSGQLIKSVPGNVGQCFATSPNGRFLAWLSPTPSPGRLIMLDLDSGQLAGEAELPNTARMFRALAFSNDGASLAGIVSEGIPPMKLMIWDLASGKIQGEFPLPAGAATLQGPRGEAEELRWMPDDNAFVIGFDLVDRISGKVYYHVTPQTIAGSTGVLRAVTSSYHILFEYPPTGTSQRVIYKSMPLPKGEVDMALKAIRGPTWNPETDVARTPDAPATSAPADGTIAAATAPADKPMTLLERVKQKEWIVTVVLVRKVDLAALDEQIRAERAKLPEIETRFTKARENAERLEQEYVTVPDARGNPIRRQVNSSKVIGDARVIADRINEETRLERQKRDAGVNREVSAKFVDGTAVELEFEGAAMVSLADNLATDSQWKVTGPARITDNVLTIKPRTFTPVQ